MLKIANLSKSYRGRQGEVRALQNVSLAISPGGFVAVKGPSGCGKTTLLLAAGGLLEPTAGQVIVDGQDLYALSPERRARFRAAKMGFVFQQFHLVPYLSVLENVLTPALATNIPDAPARAKELLDNFGLSHRIHHVPSELSTGERQRCALARAMLGMPGLLLADEPTGNLDPTNGHAVLQALADYAAAGGAVLLVTHDPRAADFAQRVVRMEKPGAAVEVST